MASAPDLHAAVAIPVPLRRTFTYRVPDAIAGEVRVGSRVRVTFARRRVVGTVVGLPEPPPAEGVTVKDLDGLAEGEPGVDGTILALTRFVADYYLCGWGEAIESALPPVAKRLPRAPARSAAPGPPERLEPTAAQAEALRVVEEALAHGRFAPFLLFGATGSGKTEVYLRAAESALASGGGVIYLVPEIGLTPLLVSRLERRFPGSIAVLHSGLNAGARREAWEAVRTGARRFAVGARSAIFAPMPKPALIVVDEEHDGSYKQEDSPRYNARDLAIVRGREAGAVVLLGSATPSLESFHHARSGRYGLLRLGGRVEGRSLPKVELVDMRREYRDTAEPRILSRALEAALSETLARGEQALILRNRRGFAPALLCPRCGERVSCRRCSVALTWHRADRRLRCHYCGREEAVPLACPSCGAEELHAVGQGTERVEEALRSLLPDARIARLDRDTVRRRGAHEALLRSFAAREIDVLVGTQMIAKGHDFPAVTLVGVVSADQTLGLPDFRAGERTFQLLTQVAGRAGRGERPGRVLVQGFDPGHPVLAEAAAQDFEAFYDREILYRRALRYPPITALVEIVVSDPDEVRAWRGAQRIADALASEGGSRLIVGGPGPAPLARLKGRYRQQILVRTAGRRRLVDAVSRAVESTAREVPARSVHVDVDPVSVL